MDCYTFTHQKESAGVTPINRKDCMDGWMELCSYLRVWLKTVLVLPGKNRPLVLYPIEKWFLPGGVDCFKCYPIAKICQLRIHYASSPLWRLLEIACQLMLIQYLEWYPTMACSASIAKTTVRLQFWNNTESQHHHSHLCWLAQLKYYLVLVLLSLMV